MARTFYGRKSPSEVPEAGQQAEMVTQGSPIPDQNEKVPALSEEAPITIDKETGAGTVIRPAANSQSKPQRVIDEEAIHEAQTILQKYKSGKANLEARVQKDELFWELRQWEAVNRGKETNKDIKDSQSVKSTSAWLFNSIVNKHADAMDNYPEPLVLPRERSDEQSADMLASILPVVLKYNKFNNIYRNNWWDKLVHGTGIYGVFWSSSKENGLGDIDIKQIDIMKVFWEPGITDIQESRNLFICELVDADLLKQMYPEHEDKIKGNPGGFQIAEYLYDESIDTSEKACVVDWYYKVHDPSGRTILHYVKFVDDVILYASENDPELKERGMYDHGKYPVVFDTMFPVKGTPAGFGFVSVERDPQMYIDALSSNILTTSLMGTKKRYFVGGNSDINLDEFADWNNPFVHCAGSLTDERIKEITVEPVAPSYINVLQMKIEEMKETSANRDVSNGGASGVSAAAAISALQEAGNKVSRDIIQNTYEAFGDLCNICIELMRQFYDERRAFRVIGANEGQYDFIEMDNRAIGNQPIINPSTGQPMFGMNGELLYRKPIFDVEVQAQRKNPFSKMEANQRAQELYAAGFFDPNRAQEALTALEMMDFEGKDKVIDSVRQGQTLMNIVQQQAMILSQMSAAMGIPTGAPQTGQQQQSGGDVNLNPNRMNNPDQKQTNAAGVARTPFAQKMARKSVPDMNNATGG